MKLALIGHRGIGKTSLLRRMRRYFPELDEDKFVCLDQFIESEQGRTISEIFKEVSESGFRIIEAEALSKIFKATEQEPHFVLALGAGCLKPLPQSWSSAWIQRGVEAQNFCFMDRPNLDGRLKMDSERFEKRSQFYSATANFCWTLGEHAGETCEEERLWSRKLFGFSKTLDLPENLYFTPGTEPLSDYSHFKAYELRDDLLSLDEMTRLQKDPRRRIIISFRDLAKVSETRTLISEKVTWDWPAEFGACPIGAPPILSCHSKAIFESGEFSGKNFGASFLKLAIQVDNFEDLAKGHKWYLDDPEARVFLPLSKNGRWQWYRQWMSPKIKFQFFRMGESQILDQPTLMQSLRVFDSDNFAAVLGSPVRHSLTPWFQGQFFEALNMPVFAIPITTEDWKAAVSFLKDLGLTHAAVTSPLKLNAQELTGFPQAVNTLFYDGESWRGANTDVLGLKPWLEDLRNKPVALWGGGGTHDAIRTVLGDVPVYSSRTGKLKSPWGGASIEATKNPKYLIWAVGAKAFSWQGTFPPQGWPLEAIYDLNYSEDSPGRECAARFGCRYESGIEMFRAQAREQQKFWRTCVSK